MLTRGEYFDLPSCFPCVGKDGVEFELPYRVYIPKNYITTSKYPVVLFLHGAGERGTDNLAPSNNFPVVNLLTNNYAQEHPCIIIVPQSRKDSWWGEDERIAISNIVSDVYEKYSVDKDRFYVTGVSMGGFGSWEYSLEHADMVAAIAVVCPVKVENFEERAPKLSNTPILIYHGENDNIAPVEYSREEIKILKNLGNQKIIYKELPGRDHHISGEAFGDPEYYKWIFSQKRVAK